MNRITFTSYDKFQNLFVELHRLIPEKFIKPYWTPPPKEYKSSKYRVWINNGVRLDPTGNIIDFGKPFDKPPTSMVNGFVFYFRDEQDYIMALLLK